ncbi:uncharacterized protein BX663DRAFT_483111 [Cokeromyces recurvatus]|uniref:uncharacterized protein n=1 Tax=Cokeromyces recurvatus TaxID=90255 RepID=UPI00221FD149|nr:uncharacterized protein BX663DRAFT_483111 [Cokeromyces recurvatus]KAI7906361.1 hypothetical protein BX663DRAFT_483111 [Cokeromyces recurvatus]
MCASTMKIIFFRFYVFAAAIKYHGKVECCYGGADIFWCGCWPYKFGDYALPVDLFSCAGKFSIYARKHRRQKSRASLSVLSRSKSKHSVRARISAELYLVMIEGENTEDQPKIAQEKHLSKYYTV